MILPTARWIYGDDKRYQLQLRCIYYLELFEMNCAPYSCIYSVEPGRNIWLHFAEGMFVSESCSGLGDSIEMFFIFKGRMKLRQIRPQI